MCKNKLHVCTYSTVRFTLRFVNLFVVVSRVCYVTTQGGICHSFCQLSHILISICFQNKFHSGYQGGNVLLFSEVRINSTENLISVILKKTTTHDTVEKCSETDRNMSQKMCGKKVVRAWLLYALLDLRNLRKR